MFDKEEYKKQVFAKYLDLKKSNYKVQTKKSFLKLIIEIISIGAFTISAGVFAYNGVVQNLKIEQSSEVVEERVKEYDNMPHAYNVNIEYYKIKTIDEYNDFKAVHKGLLKMTEKDFENSFLFVIWDSGEIEITDIDSTDEELKVEITRDAEKEQKLRNASEHKVLSTKISKELDRDKVRINEYVKLSTLGNLKPLKAVLDYTKEELVKEGYIVIEQNENNSNEHVLISKNQDKIDKFVEDLNNNKNAMIRVIECNDLVYKFHDFKYVDGILYDYSYWKWKTSNLMGVMDVYDEVEYNSYKDFKIVKDTVEEYLIAHPETNPINYSSAFQDIEYRIYITTDDPIIPDGEYWVPFISFDY